MLGLDDLCVRFIVNLPKEELESVERICFQVEEAQWFYEDFIRPLDPQLPSLNLRQFCLLIFQHCPLLSGFSPYHHSAAFSEFLAYKTRVPVRGAIMLNEAMDHVVLVKGWKKGANWSFPRGKINKDEKDLDCAVREVYEETGFDITAAGLVAAEDDAKYIEVTMREQHMRLYVFRNVPMDTIFEPRTRKEISKIQWYKLSELPTIKKKQHQQEGKGEDLAKNANKFYMVAPFLVPLKKWIAQQKKQDMARGASTNGNTTSTNLEITTSATAAQIVDQSAKAPPPDDMSRLLANLRNSSQKLCINDALEISDPAQTARNASIQLKNLLHVPIKPSVELNSNSNHQAEVAADGQFVGQAQADEIKRKNESAKANAMLSSLRTVGTVSQHRPPYNNLPHTPFEQVLNTPPIPNSPRHHVSRMEHAPILIPAPQFPYSPDQVGVKNEEQVTRLPQNGQSAILSKGGYPLTSSKQRFEAPRPFQTSLYNSTKASHLPLAPYQRTGDPQFAQAPKQSFDVVSSIPPASNLPLPKLTSHSSLLLDIFKSGGSGRATTKSDAIDAQPVVEQSGAKSGPQESNTAAAIPDTENSEASQARSPQKEALLNLFRASSKSTPDLTQRTPTTLEPPSAPIELSAFPSPSHSRAPSQATQEPFIPLPKPTINGKTTIKRGSESVRTMKSSTNAPVSATVTGPLNVPQFDKIAKKLNSPRSKNKLSREQDALKEQQLPSMTRLARPGREHQSSKVESMKPVRENMKTRGQTLAPVSAPQTSTRKSEIPKPFAPQILRRPPQAPKHDAHVPPSPLQIVTKANATFDRPSASCTSAQDHRNSLLSLFNKPSPGPSPLTPTHKPLVSPFSEQPVRSESVGPFPLDTPRSRMGSLGDGFGTVRDGKSSGRQTPRTNPADKLALLNFLDGVIKKG